MTRPIARLQFILDQAVGGFRVGHTQQRFGQHHQRQPFLGGQRIGVEKVLDPAETAGTGPDCLDETRGARVDARFCIAPAARGRQ